MRAGRLRQRVELQMTSQTRNTWGDVVEAWATYDTVWAGIRPVSGTERRAAQQAQAEVTHEIRIRYHKGVSPIHRVLYKTRVFAINSIINQDERNKELVLQCTEQVDSGVL